MSTQTTVQYTNIVYPPKEQENKDVKQLRSLGIFALNAKNP